MKRAHGLVFAAMLIVYCAAHAGDPGQSSAPANSAVASGSFPKQLVLEWYRETSATGQHLYKEIGVSPDGQFMYVADVYEDAVLVFRTDDAATPIESFSDISWAQAGVWPYAVDVAMDGMVYVSTFDVNGDAINDNALLRWDPVGKVLTRLCALPQPVRGIQVSGQGLNTVVYASGNGRPPEPGIVLRCTPVSSDVFAVETLFSTGVYLNQQDVAARNGGKDLYVSTWSHDRREGAAALAAPAVTEEKPVTVAYYYRVRWGFQQEFERLFFKNHYPVLKEQMVPGGRIKGVSVYRPTFHGDGRADWSFLVVITFSRWNVLGGPSPDEAIAKRLYPDQEAFTKEEQRRFEILDAHWDVPLVEVEPPK